jgi:hypothetical protein
VGEVKASFFFLTRTLTLSALPSRERSLSAFPRGRSADSNEQATPIVLSFLYINCLFASRCASLATHPPTTPSFREGVESLSPQRPRGWAALQTGIATAKALSQVECSRADVHSVAIIST